MKFSGKNWPNNTLAPPPLELAPPPFGKSWIRYWILLADIFIKTHTPTCLDGPFFKDEVLISWSFLRIWCCHCWYFNLALIMKSLVNSELPVFHWYWMLKCAWTLRFIYTERKRTRKEIFLLSLSLLDVNCKLNFLWTHLEATLLSLSFVLSVNGHLIRNNTRKHSSRMRTDRALTRMSCDRVAIRPIVDRMTDACENITFPCGR